jgi:hypothetical protein
VKILSSLSLTTTRDVSTDQFKVWKCGQLKNQPLRHKRKWTQLN